MCSKCYNGFLAAIVIVFSFWTTSFSWWVVVIAAALILISQIKKLSCYGCTGKLSMDCHMCPSCGVGQELFVDKNNKIPTPDEVKKVIKKKKKR